MHIFCHVFSFFLFYPLPSVVIGDVMGMFFFWGFFFRFGRRDILACGVGCRYFIILFFELFFSFFF